MLEKQWWGHFWTESTAEDKETRKDGRTAESQRREKRCAGAALGSSRAGVVFPCKLDASQAS